jgi:hypothetical protein
MTKCGAEISVSFYAGKFWHTPFFVTNKAISMKSLIVKSLLSSLCKREEVYPSLAKRGKGRFFNNNTLLMHSSGNPLKMKIP